MELKKYESFSIQDAVKKIRLELGKDAIIFSTREKSTDESINGTKQKIFEVVAAKNVTSQDVSNIKKVEFPKVTLIEPSTIVKGTPTLQTLSKNGKPAFQSQNSFAIKNQSEVTSSIVNDSLPQLEEMRREILKVKKEIESIPQLNIREQMEDIKTMLYDIMRERSSQSSQNQNNYTTDILVKLRTAGISESIISDISVTLDNLNEKIINSSDKSFDDEDKLRDFYLHSCIKYLIKNINIKPFLSSSTERGLQILSLVGSTGVGKTTTLAKLAAYAQLQNKKKIAMLSMDSYRIAGADQLRIYAKILDCPFDFISTPEELLNFVNKNYNFDYIFLDTAGRNPKDLKQLEELYKYKETNLNLQFHLALSTTMKQRDLDENIKSFRILNPQTLIFSKLDESMAYGEIVNCTIRSGIPLSYFATGVQVPDDLEIASKERIIERIFHI